MEIKNLPNLGVGIGFRKSFTSSLLQNPEKIDFLEIIAEHYIDASKEKLFELELLKEYFTLIPHSISLSLGSAFGLDKVFIKKLAKLINSVSPPWFSDHISFNLANNINIGHLSPLPFNKEAIEVFCNNVKYLKAIINTPLLLENITYMFEIPTSEMKEEEFISEILEKTDSGMLLDITNLYINSVNLNYDPINFLNKLPKDRVVQLHFIGGYKSNTMLIDSHSEKTPEEVWNIMKIANEKFNIKGAILEWDENIPPFEILVSEVNQAKQILAIKTKN